MYSSCAQGTRVAHCELRETLRSHRLQRGKPVGHGEKIRRTRLDDTGVPQQLFSAGNARALRVLQLIEIVYQSVHVIKYVYIAVAAIGP